MRVKKKNNNYQRNKVHQAEQALAHCQTHGNFLRSRELYGHLIIRAQKRCNVILLTEKFAQQHLILNLRGQILLLQNNSLPNPLIANMATISEVIISLGPQLAQIPQYIGQEPPDDYYNKIMQIFHHGDTLAVAGFNNAVKTQLLSSKLAGRFISPNSFNNAAGNVVVTPALFIGWL